MPLSAASRLWLLDVACNALREQLGEAGPQTVCPDDPVLLQPAGCFVSLHERISHRLRGCIGRIEARHPLWETVRLASQDVLRDPRFVTCPVRPGELACLEIEISMLSPPRDAASPLDFDLLNDGIYLVHLDRSGFFLPQVARQTGWTREQLLERLCTEKLDLAADTWKHPDARLYTFDVEIIGPAGIEEKPVTQRNSSP